MKLLALVLGVAVLSHGVASYEYGGYSVSDEEGSAGEHEDDSHGHGHKNFNPKLEVIHGPHEHIKVKGYSTQLQDLGQHVEIPEPPIKVIRVTKTVAIKVPVPYPVKIQERVPYPVTVHKPYPVPVTQVVHVPTPVHVPHQHKHAEAAPVWPAKEDNSEYSEHDGDETAKVSHGLGGDQASFGEGSFGGGNSYGGGGAQFYGADGGHQGGGDGGGDGGDYSKVAGSGFSGGFEGHQSSGASAANQGSYGGGFGGGDESGHHEGNSGSFGHEGYQGATGVGNGGDYHAFQPEAKSYDAAIQEYLQKLSAVSNGGGGGGGGGGGYGDSYAGSYNPGHAYGADDYHRVHELETTKVDRVHY